MEEWEVIPARMYFAGGANRRYNSWDVGVRPSEARDLPQGSWPEPDSNAARTVEDITDPPRLLHTLTQQ